MGKLGQRKFLSFKKEFGSQQENEQSLANLVKELTGDFIKYIDCQFIQDENNPQRNEVVYYGPEEDLAIGAKAEVILSAAMFDVYENENVLDRTWFSWTNELECWKGLDPDKKYLGLFNGPGLEHKFYEQDSSSMPSIEDLSQQLILRALKLEPMKWSKRAYRAIAQFNTNTLILFVPGQVNISDWRVKLGMEINELIRKDVDSDMFNLILPYIPTEAYDDDLEDLAQLSSLSNET